MAEEIIFKLGVDTGDSAAQVGAIDKEFDALRKSIKDTEKEVDNLSKDFGANSQQAEAARKKLSNLNQSYKELSKAATDVSAKFEDVYGELQPLTTRMGEAEDRLYELALAGKTNTKEYQDLLETVARYRQTQIETDRVVDNAAQTFTQKLGGAIQGAASGFQLVQGASALFGEESEELEKTLLKVQAAMALADGIEGVRQALPMFTNFAQAVKGKVLGAFTSLTTAQIANAQATGTMTALQKVYTFIVGTSTGAMKGFKVALATSGIGLVVVALGMAAEAMGLFGSSTDKTTEALEKQNAEEEKGLSLLNEVIGASERKRNAKKGGLNDLEKELALSKAKGVSDAELYKLERDVLDKQLFNAQVRYNSYDLLSKKEREQARATHDEISGLKLSMQVLDTEFYAKSKEKREKANEEATKTRQEEHKKQLEEIKQNNLKKIELENARILEQENLENEYYDSFKTQQELEVQAVRDKYNKIIETTTDNETLKLARQKELDVIANKYKVENDKIESDRLSNIDKQYEDYYNQYYDATTAAYQKEQDAVNEKYFYLIEKAKEYGLETIELEKKRQEELDKIQTPEKQAINEFKNLYRELSTAIQTSTEIDLNNLQTKHSSELELLKDNYGEKENYADLEYGLKMRQYNEEKAIIDRQRAFAEFQKKIAIVQTTIDTAKALSATISGAASAASAGGPAAPFLLAGYIASGVATISTAYAKVKTLLNSPMPSIQPPKMPRDMKDGISGDVSNGETQTIQAQSTYKVVVVDSDITNMQNKTKKVQAISTI
jgi:hypothetical protein